MWAVYNVPVGRIWLAGRRFPIPALEGLNSSLAQSGAELWLNKIFPERAYHTLN